MKFDYNAWLANKAEQAAEKWFAGQCKNEFAHYHLYFKQGDITISDEELHPEWTLATGERISLAKSKEQVKYWAIEILRRCPCLPLDR